MAASFFCSYPLVLGAPNLHSKPPTLCRGMRIPPLAMAASSPDGGGENSSQGPTKLVTFLGKGGSGKTITAIFAAQHYAISGLNTCLVIHGQDTTADYLLNCRIRNSPVVCNKNLSAVRLESTKMLLEPLNRLKEADAQLNMTQGTLAGIVGEELGILPGMDSIFSALALERLVRFLRTAAPKNQQNNFDIVVYDGLSSEETLRMIGAASKARLYLRYLRNLAEKTDLGRLAGPSLLRLVDEAMSISGSRSYFNGSAEIWDTLDQLLKRGTSAFSDPQRFGCFLVMDPNNPTSVNSASRYWGCTIQAGAQVSGAFGICSQQLNVQSQKTLKNDFSPLHLALIPSFSMNNPIDWNKILLNTGSEYARLLLTLTESQCHEATASVKFDTLRRSVTLFMPGFDKSEIKLYQYRGRSELLVEAGDQRRVIALPAGIQGKVGGAKFMDRSLVITLH